MVRATSSFAVAVVLAARVAWGGPLEFDLLTDPVDWTAWGSAESATGDAVASGDLNGDGSLDLIVGQDYWPSPVAGARAGRVLLFPGPVGMPAVHDLASAAPSIEIASTIAGFRFGFTLHVADLDADGLDDLIVGSHSGGPDGLRTAAGSVAIFLGRSIWPATLTLDDADWLFHGADERDDLYVAASGDLDGDGTSDLAMFAPQADGPSNTREDSGEGYIFFGPPPRWSKRTFDLSVDPADVHIFGADGTADNPQGTSGDLFGSRAYIANVLGDALPDLIVSAAAGAGPANARGNCGEAYVFAGRPAWPATLDLRFVNPDLLVHGQGSTSTISNGGIQGVGVADLDADGIPEMLLARPYAAAAGRQGAGTIEILRGGPGLAGIRDLNLQPSEGQVFGPRAGSRLGIRLATGDVNGDGFIDIVSGSPYGHTPFDRFLAGEVLVVTSCGRIEPVLDLAVNPPAFSVYGALTWDEWGRSPTVADVDADGFADVFAGANRSASLNGSRGAYAGEAHLLRGRPTASVCSVNADAGPPRSACAGQPLTLDGSGTRVTGCTAVPQYRWLRGPTVVADWSAAPSASIQVSTTTLYTLEVRCGDCAGPCLGRASVTVTALPDPVPGDQGNVLLAARLGPDVDLWFNGAPASDWRLFRDPVKASLGLTPLTPDVSVTRFTDGGVVPLPPPLQFYRLKGLSPCSRTPGP